MNGAEEMVVSTQENWLTVEDAAKRLDVTEETVRRLLRKRALRGMQISKRAGWRIRASDLDAFIESRFTGGPEPRPIDDGGA
jgi:excisionase family DNA binding protein